MRHVPHNVSTRHDFPPVTIMPGSISLDEEDNLVMTNDELTDKKQIIVCYSPGCPHCVNAREAIIAYANKAYRGKLRKHHVDIVSVVNVDLSRDIASLLKVTHIPCYFYYDGKSFTKLTSMTIQEALGEIASRY